MSHLNMLASSASPIVIGHHLQSIRKLCYYNSPLDSHLAYVDPIYCEQFTLNTEVVNIMFKMPFSFPTTE